jgi:hypothetical protein
MSPFIPRSHLAGGPMSPHDAAAEEASQERAASSKAKSLSAVDRKLSRNQGQFFRSRTKSLIDGIG